MNKLGTPSWLVIFGLSLSGVACSSGSDGPRDLGPRDNVTGGTRNPVCTAGQSAGEVQAPTFVRNIPGETSWFASPIVKDLDGDGTNEIVASYYATVVYDASGNELARVQNNDRVYAPHIVADIDNDGVMDVVTGNGNFVNAYAWQGGALVSKPGWPANVTTANNAPEVRGMAAADLDDNGTLEIIVTTTQTASTADGGAQVFVYSADGTSYQPPGITWTAWPRYNNLTGAGNDADRNGQGHEGYGCYGLNVGVGNIDDDPEPEILVTYDNHQIQAFDRDGVAIDSSPWFTNPDSNFDGQRMTWGQFIRWADPAIEQAHYHDHTGEWPNPSFAEWLQWTASPPNVADLDGDGLNEVVGVPNVELHDPYVTQAFAVMVLEGAYGTGDRSAMRKVGFETLPRGEPPILIDGWYPPLGVPAPVTVNLQGDAKLEIVVSLNDGYMTAFGADGHRLWRQDYTFGKNLMYSSEPTIADLNQDGSPEVVFSTYGDPDSTDSGHLVILGADGSLLHDVPLPNPGHNGNGNGAPAAPTIADVDGDGTLEILVQTFDHGMDIFTVPGSGDACVLWGTSRGGPLRTGAPSAG